MSNTTSRAPFDFSVVRTCKIHPGIGIARVGNSPDDFFLGPQVPCDPRDVRVPPGGFKDADGRVKRQAAHFRIYAYGKDEDGKEKVLGELPIRGRHNASGGKADVEWTVHLANKKGAWYKFQSRHDPRPRELRNPDVPIPAGGTPNDRQELIINPGPRSIDGLGNPIPFGNDPRAPKDACFDTGCFRQTQVPLGELRTDDHGRLLVLGGFGKSGSTKHDNPIGAAPNPDPEQDPEQENNDFYANNDYWYDDVSDGPITATVTLPDGRVIKIEDAKNAAWVIVAPPKFAPGIYPIVTLYELLREVAIDAGWITDYPDVEYFRDIYPILMRAADAAWVNTDARRGHGYDKWGDFREGKDRPKMDASLLASSFLKSPAPSSVKVGGLTADEFRNRVFCRLRNPLADGDVKTQQATTKYMPVLNGDDGRASEDEPETWFSILPSQYKKFEKWKDGQFEDGRLNFPKLEEMSAKDQTEALQQAALEPCVGGAFLPGIEMTYIATHKELYAEAFRIDSTVNRAGDITKYMALPWQADFYMCKFNWWPAQRPDDVVSQEVFEEADRAWREGAGVPAVSEALEGRVKWDRGFGVSTLFRWGWQNPAVALDDPRDSQRRGCDDMVRYWSELGFVVPRLTASGKARQEKEIVHVEMERRPYAGMDVRELFHALLNEKLRPTCHAKAKEYVERILKAAWRVQRTATAFNLRDNIRPFRYDERLFEARMQDIYDDSADFAFVFKTKGGQREPYNPDDAAHNPLFRSHEAVTERIRQLTPFNFLDGAWLRNIHRVGPVDEVNSILFSISKEELGDGVPSQNHANIYRDLCHSFGFYPPDVASSAFARDPQFLDAAFDSATFQLAISEFTERYYPEIIGMSLWLEWTVVDLHRISEIVERVGLSAHFYRMHIAIDNADRGHGASILRAVKLYLQQARQHGGDRAVQSQWRRIWNGYVAFQYTFSVLIEQLKYDIRMDAKEKKNRLNRLQKQLVNLVGEKKTYGQYNHGYKKLGCRYINDWFADPESFLTALVEEKWIVPGKPHESPFFELVEFKGGRRYRNLSNSHDEKSVEFEGGRMYSVFNQDEIQLWRDWTVELGRAEAEKSLKLIAQPEPISMLLRISPAFPGSAAVDSVRRAISDDRAALWLEIAEQDEVNARAAFSQQEPQFFTSLKAQGTSARAKQFLAWSMIRAITYIAAQTWIDFRNDTFVLTDESGRSRTSAHWLTQVRDARNPARAARALMAALKSHFEQDRSPQASGTLMDRMKASPVWEQAFALMVPGNDDIRVRDTMAGWLAIGAPVPEISEGKIKPLRLDATLDEEERHPTGIALGFGTVH